MKVELDEGKYEVEFRYNNYEYDYEINAYSGKILSHDKEYDAPPETKPVETTKATEAAKTLIGKDKAKSIALEHAGVSASKASNVKVELDEGKYEVEFRYNNYEYDYEINAYSGKILSHDKEYDAPPETKPVETTKATEAAKVVIGKDKAKSIALDHAGVSASKASNVKVELDDGKYEVEFRYNNYEYDYEINAYSGKILSHDKEYDAPPETKPVETTKATEAAKTLIGKDKAKSIALDHAGLSASEVRGLEVDYDKDDGIPIYEVEFESGKLEYSYEIHGYTGKILSREVDD